MKKLVLFVALAMGFRAGAQVSVTGTDLKLSDVIDYYNKYEKPYRNHENEPESKKTGLAGKKFPERLENKDYQFDRWKWYWQQHLDGNGYMVSPVKTFNSWKAYQDKAATSRLTSSSGSNWVFQGDDSSGAGGSGVGRISVVAFHPTDANTYWIGSPGGGAWKTTNNGVTWTNMTNQLPLIAVTDIKINPANPNTIYLCTGDKDGSDYYSIGLLKSYNGGTTWNTTGITYTENQFRMANAILVNPIDTNSLIYASSQGIYRSFDGGTTWHGPVIGGNFMQLLYNPTDTNIVYATTYYNYGSGTPAQIFRSLNGGDTWTEVTHFTDGDRITLAVTPAAPGLVKAIVSASDGTNQDGLYGIFNSTDSGGSFTEIFTPAACGSGNQNLLSYNADGTQCGGQGFYDLTLAIDPTNANNVYCGGVNAWQSADGGSTWQIMNQWDSTLTGVVAIHADKHFMGFNPLVAGRYFETNDGGIYWSDNPNANSVWNNVTNGLGITQFYRMAVSNVATYEIGGAQDVGTKYIQGSTYIDADGGDGMECQMDPVDGTTFYASIYYGEIDLFTTTGGWMGTVSNNIPGTPQGGWVTPYILEPTCHTCVVAGYQDVYRSADEGTTWADISGPLTTGDLLRVVTTLADSNTFYAAEDGTNNLYYTHNMGATAWTTLTAPYSGQVLSDVYIDPWNAKKVWVAFSGYTTGGSPQVVEYNEVTNTWTPYNTNLPDVPVNCIQIDTQNRTMYVGTEVGVFYRDSLMSEWEPYSTGMPVVSVTDIQFDYATGKIWASTFGRSMWSSSRHIPYPTAVATIKTAPDQLSIWPNPNHGEFNVSLNNAVSLSDVDIKIIDNIGRTVWTGSSAVKSATIFVNTAGIAAGDYTLELNAAGNTGVLGRSKIVIY